MLNEGLVVVVLVVLLVAGLLFAVAAAMNWDPEGRQDEEDYLDLDPDERGRSRGRVAQRQGGQWPQTEDLY
ncbi:hypothetical protein ACLMAJ_13560 [Nocardia sp. KC 131]|uniref:hypothetical protein n=1 Tax=Nocardia arseniciresistens TaxID=3392119 RepID=UPI00398EA0BF